MHETTVLDAREPAGKRRLAIDRRRRHDLGQPAREAAVIRFVPQRPIEPRRGNLERIRLPQGRFAELLVLDVEQRAEILADPLAVRHTDVEPRSCGASASIARSF